MSDTIDSPNKCIVVANIFEVVATIFVAVVAARVVVIPRCSGGGGVAAMVVAVVVVFAVFLSVVVGVAPVTIASGASYIQ